MQHRADRPDPEKVLSGLSSPRLAALGALSVLGIIGAAVVVSQNSAPRSDDAGIRLDRTGGSPTVFGTSSGAPMTVGETVTLTGEPVSRSLAASTPATLESFSGSGISSSIAAVAADPRTIATGGGGGGGSTPTKTPSPSPTSSPGDTTPPETSASTLDSSSDTWTIEVTADEAATFECSLDVAAFVSCTSPVLYQELELGSHTFAARATDAAGNTDPTPVELIIELNPGTSG